MLEAIGGAGVGNGGSGAGQVHFLPAGGFPYGPWPYRDPAPWWSKEPEREPSAPETVAVRVLVVDDNARTRAGLRALLLTTPGVKVVGEATDGTAAVRLTARLRPDVVLMDVRLPGGVDGLEATRAIKSHQPEVRVVVLTISAAYRAEAMASGADAFLVKGGPADELVSAVLGAEDPGPRAGRKRGRRHDRLAPQRRPYGPSFGTPLV